MSTISNGPVNLHVEDSGGDGRPVVLIHGWPLSGDSWSAQVPALTDAGYRVVTYDRRGFGASDKPGDASTYDYDTLTGDLDAVLTGLDLREVTLVGFSMGGGEVARYLGTHGSDRVHSAVFAAAIPPCLKLDGDHPGGALDDDTVRGMQNGLEADPPGFLDGFTRNFFSADGALQVSEAQQQEALGLALQADVHAARECIRSWTTDFRGGPGHHHRADARHPRRLRRDRPDREVGPATAEQVAGSELHVIEGGRTASTPRTPRSSNATLPGVPPALTAPSAGSGRVGLRLGCRGRAVDAGLLALLRRDRRRRAGQRVVAAAGLREGDDVADRVGAGRAACRCGPSRTRCRRAAARRRRRRRAGSRTSPARPRLGQAHAP